MCEKSWARHDNVSGWFMEMQLAWQRLEHWHRRTSCCIKKSSILRLANDSSNGARQVVISTFGRKKEINRRAISVSDFNGATFRSLSLFCTHAQHAGLGIVIAHTTLNSNSALFFLMLGAKGQQIFNSTLYHLPFAAWPRGASNYLLGIRKIIRLIMNGRVTSKKVIEQSTARHFRSA